MNEACVEVLFDIGLQVGLCCEVLLEDCELYCEYCAHIVNFLESLTVRFIFVVQSLWFGAFGLEPSLWFGSVLLSCFRASVLSFRGSADLATFDL